MGRSLRPSAGVGMAGRFRGQVARRRRLRPGRVEGRERRCNVRGAVRGPVGTGGQTRARAVVVHARSALERQRVHRGVRAVRRGPDGVGGHVPAPQVRGRPLPHRERIAHVQRGGRLPHPHRRGSVDQPPRRTDTGGIRPPPLLRRPHPVLPCRGRIVRPGHPRSHPHPSIPQGGTRQDFVGRCVRRRARTPHGTRRGHTEGSEAPVPEGAAVLRRHWLLRAALLRSRGVPAVHRRVPRDQQLLQHRRLSGEEDGVEVPSRGEGRGGWRQSGSPQGQRREEEEEGQEAQAPAVPHHQRIGIGRGKNSPRRPGELSDARRERRRARGFETLLGRVGGTQEGVG
mmetsp:Transcript_38202/g.114289  ORF Transcript_38202/g.114289 Transcript_38202/m.114289 type:complete len:342 (-) Transcript_38202:467-1492(-)